MSLFILNIYEPPLFFMELKAQMGHGERSLLTALAVIRTPSICCFLRKGNIESLIKDKRTHPCLMVKEDESTMDVPGQKMGHYQARTQSGLQLPESCLITMK